MLKPLGTLGLFCIAGLACGAAPSPVPVPLAGCPSARSHQAMRVIHDPARLAGTYWLTLVATSGSHRGKSDSGILRLLTATDGHLIGSAGVDPWSVGGSADIAAQRSDGVHAGFRFPDSAYVISIGSSGTLDGWGIDLEVTTASDTTLAGRWMDYRTGRHLGHFCATRQ